MTLCTPSGAVKKDDRSIQVVVADPQEVARIGTCEVLEGAGVDVVAETESGTEALRLARELAPDVLVCELDLPDLSGLQLAVRLAEEDSPVQLLALSAYEDERYVRHLMENGIAGYLKKSEAPERIVEAVRGLARGEEGWLSPEIARKAMKLEQKSDCDAWLKECGVTERERDVLRLLMEGHANDEIAARLFIAKNTVRTHVSHLYTKLGVNSRPEAVAWAWEHGLTPPHAGGGS